MAFEFPLSEDLPSDVIFLYSIGFFFLIDLKEFLTIL
jgi:hypothetical protein